ncbi:immunity 70 family protein [Listeria welshimeri]|uniref:immunity 70 family protein n=1 Tax=Listeria welshimeri TaxID=1643 RepID=UPI001887C16B|nr:immunity 70 family protein [Listeria welshimeri]MBF2456559.1 immunity 70 family protein [Listeria welshimeri]MBF2568390.1 immunity 70 family protein [Listeria welshimeri]
MSVGIKVDFLWFPVGNSDFLHSFFSTICVNLEDSKWGSKYPVFMKKLYSGRLNTEDLAEAKKELNDIKEALSNLSPDKIVWDAEDLQKNPPWGIDISSDIKNLSEYFITSDGKNLISILNEALDESLLENVNLEIKNL